MLQTPVKKIFLFRKMNQEVYEISKSREGRDKTRKFSVFDVAMNIMNQNKDIVSQQNQLALLELYRLFKFKKGQRTEIISFIAIAYIYCHEKEIRLYDIDSFFKNVSMLIRENRTELNEQTNYRQYYTNQIEILKKKLTGSLQCIPVIRFDMEGELCNVVNRMIQYYSEYKLNPELFQDQISTQHLFDFLYIFFTEFRLNSMYHVHVLVFNHELFGINMKDILLQCDDYLFPVQPNIMKMLNLYEAGEYGARKTLEQKKLVKDLSKEIEESKIKKANLRKKSIQANKKVEKAETELQKNHRKITNQRNKKNSSTSAKGRAEAEKKEKEAIAAAEKKKKEAKVAQARADEAARQLKLEQERLQALEQERLRVQEEQERQRLEAERAKPTTRTTRIPPMIKLKKGDRMYNLPSVMKPFPYDFSQFQTSWGTRNPNNITQKMLIDMVEKSKDIQFYATLKPYISKTPKIDTSVVQINGSKLEYNCVPSTGEDIINRTARLTKYDRVFDEIYDEPNLDTIQKIFNKTLKRDLFTDKDVFIAAYGQSGSGKSFLMTGPEDGSAKGLQDLVLETIHEQGVQQIDILPLQIYNGSVYNAFYGPVQSSCGSRDKQDCVLNWFIDEHVKFKIAEFNYCDMLHQKNYNGIARYPPQIEGNVDNDPLGVYFPPTREMLNYLLNQSGSIEQIHQGQKCALNASNMNEAQIRDALKSNIIRPERDTGLGLNAVSSRSHLFTIFRFKINGRFKWVTIADFGGIENFSASGQKIPWEQADERFHLVDSGGLVAFRKMFKSYLDNPLSEKKDSYKYKIISNPPDKSYDKKIFGYSSDTRALIQVPDIIKKTREKTNISTLFANNNLKQNVVTFKTPSSAMFNLVRALSGMFSNNHKCTHKIYCCFHKYANAETENKICKSTGTVLNNL